MPFNEALKAPFPCNNLLVNQGDTSSFAKQTFTAEELTAYRKTVQRSCPQYLSNFDAVSPQLMQQAASASAVSASSSSVATASEASQSAANAQNLADAQSQMASRTALPCVSGFVDAGGS